MGKTSFMLLSLYRLFADTNYIIIIVLAFVDNMHDKLITLSHNYCLTIDKYEFIIE